MNRRTLIAAAACLALAVAGLVKSLWPASADYTPVPRRTAFVRLPALDTAMTAVDSLAVALKVNASATLSRPAPGWLNVAFPAYGATLHITVTQAAPAGIEDVKANRMQRLMLNSSDMPTDFAEFTNPGGFDVVVATTEGCATPVQFIATDNSSCVVSGAVFFPGFSAGTPADSLRPAIDMLHADVLRTAASIAPVK